MDTKSLSSSKKTTSVAKDTQTETKEVKKSGKEQLVSKQMYDKDKEIAELKKQLAEAQKVNQFRPEDIRARTNRMGDVAKVCIGVNEFGHREWKKATELTDEDIKRRDEYIEGIKQLNAKKY